MLFNARLRTDNNYTKGYDLKSEARSIQYFDIFLASYDRQLFKAKRIVSDRKTGKEIYERVWFRLSDELLVALDVDNPLLYSFPPKDPDAIKKFDVWLEKQLLDEINNY